MKANQKLTSCKAVSRLLPDTLGLKRLRSLKAKTFTDRLIGYGCLSLEDRVNPEMPDV